MSITSLLPAVEKLAPHLKSVKHYVVMGDTVPADCKLNPVHAYEELLSAVSPIIPGRISTRTTRPACATPRARRAIPKGVVYSHRSIYLHCLGLTMADSLGLCERDIFLPVVPMFHVMAWGTPFACAMVGSKIGLSRPALDSRAIWPS